MTATPALPGNTPPGDALSGDILSDEPADTSTRDDGRMPSGIAGLDAILGGGFLRGGLTIIQGRPGTGKTILGNQICFNHARTGGRALYVTLLAENHARMMRHMRPMRFYDPALIPDGIYFISAFTVLEAEETTGLLTLLRREMRAHKATVLVLDGLIAAEQSAASDLQFKKFIHELQTQATLADCAMFLLTSGSGDEDLVRAEHTMVDCVVSVRSHLHGWQAERQLEVLKCRGSDHARGRHSFTITNDGLVVFPRIEAMLRLPSLEAHPGGGVLSTGVRELDRMTSGGLPLCSTTLVVGPPGTGKTTLGLHFLGQCDATEPGLHLSLYEDPGALRAKAEALDLPVAAAMAAGHVALQWHPMTEGLLDAIFAQMLDTVRSRGVRRLVVDGLGGMAGLAAQPSRLVHIVTAVANELRALGVTSLFTTTAEDSVPAEGASFPLPPINMLSIADNVLLLRYAALRSDLTRLLSVLKVRNAEVDTRLRVYEMTRAGLVLDGDPARADAILGELASPPPARRPRTVIVGG